jgi:hypothetical protein
MAFPTIPTAGASRVLTSYQADTTGTRTFPSLTGLTKNSGDLLIAICIAYQSSTTNAQFSGWGASFNEFHDTGTGSTMAIGAAYKWSDGTETGTFSVTQAATITGHACFILLSIPGAHAASIPEAGSRVSGTTSAADPGSFDPSWAAEDILWIAVGGAGEDSTTAAWTGLASAPSSYTDYAETGLGGQDVAGAVEGAVAFRQLNATSTDVGTFSVDVANARNAAVVIAVRPAAVTSPNAEAVAITATAEQPVASVSPNAEGVAVTAAALDATISTEAPGTNAQAEAAEATAAAEAASGSVGPNAGEVAIAATAETPVASVGPNAEAVAVTVTAENASTSTDPNAGAVGVAATSEAPAASVSPNAAEAAITAAALDATIETTGATNVQAECATATAEANVVSAELSLPAENAAVAATAETASAAVDVMAEAAAIVAAAYDAVITGGDEAVGWHTPYSSSTPPSLRGSLTSPDRQSSSNDTPTYTASTARGVL